MSALGKGLRDFLVGRAGYSTYLSGGLHPDNNPTGKTMPFASYQQISRTRETTLAGVTVATTERVQVDVVAMTRAQAQATAQWIADQVKATPSRQTVGSLVIFQWRIEDETGASEYMGDASDESVRTVQVDLIGTYLEV